MTPYNTSWLYVIGGILFSSLAQIFLKRATFVEAKQALWVLFVSSSVLCYLISFFAYYLALREFSISRVSPVMTIGVVLIVVTYGFWAGETVTVKQSLGVVLGIISIALILS